MLLGDENSPVRVRSPSSLRLWSVLVQKTLPPRRSRQQASSHPSHRPLSENAVRPCPPVPGPRSSSSVPPLQLSVLHPVRPARLFHRTKRGASSHLPCSVSLGAAGAWGSGTMLSGRPPLSAIDTSRAEQTTAARIEVSGYAGVHLKGGDQCRPSVDQQPANVPFRLKKSGLYFPENARLLGKSPINSII